MELCFNGNWGTICDDDWGSEEAAVVCGQLGFPKTGVVPVIHFSRSVELHGKP